MWDEIEILVNLWDEQLTITKTPDGATATFEDGETRIYTSMDRAINAAYRMGYIL